MFSRIILAIQFATLPLLCKGQFSYDESKLSISTKRIVSEFREKYHLTLDSIGSKNETRNNYQDYLNFIMLAQSASTNELIELTCHPAPVIRCYSFWALSKRDSSNLTSIILAHVNDTTLQVNAYMGSFYAIFSVKEFFLNVISNEHYNSSKVKLSSREKRIVDSLNENE